MATKITNDPRITVRIANLLLERAAELLAEANGHPLTADQEATNDEAEVVIEYANELRARWGKPALTVTPKPRAGASDSWST